MPKKTTVAVIDVGSHEISLKIAELSQDRLPREIDAVRQTLPIGSDTYRSGEISQPVLSQCIVILQSMLKKVEEYQVDDIRAVATSAFREAKNGIVAIERIRHACGLMVDILPNSREIFLHQLAASEHIPEFDSMIANSTLMLFLGAGNIQLSLFDRGSFVHSQSMRLGPLRVRELLADLEKHTPDFNALVTEYLFGDLQYYRNFEPKKTDYKCLIIQGSNTTYLRHLLDPKDNRSVEFSTDRLQRVMNRLHQLKSFELVQQSGIPQEQATLLLPAGLIVEQVLQFTKLETF